MDLIKTLYAFLSVDLLNPVVRKVENLQRVREQGLYVHITESPGEIVLNARRSPTAELRQNWAERVAGIADLSAARADDRRPWTDAQLRSGR